ncbi:MULTISPECIES: LuxR C-terminal-related transcriptional regulator [unclassified Mycobacterium]|uniref:LuxR C-terminal-related transcriptional regulator n=1 Tax=unclassified Mycobacterium TaxID=2642494 RepID=UPI0029C9208D|nr:MULTISPECIES: LuxR C-terminal-related transcriptional regulator [unclassified Mycobacterium]
MNTTGERKAKGHLARGRAAYRRRAWLDAFAELSASDQDRPLAADDLERMAQSAYLTNRDDEAIRTLERAYTRYLDAGEAVSAARCTFWISLGLLNCGEPARANGWVARGNRLLGRRGDCVESGYLLVPAVLAHMGAGGDLEAALDDAAVIAEIGEQFGDVDLVSFAMHAQGRVSIKQGGVTQGIALLDEAMVAVVAGDLASPLFTGLIYCQAIDACEEVFDARRAQEWTDALGRWCDSESQMVTFTGICLVHRAGVLQLHGAWPAAIEEARRACDRLMPGEPATGAGRYRQAEIYRLRGEFVQAEQAYRDAYDMGWQPQPGLALLWLAQGRTDAAAAAIRRMLAETIDRGRRARLLPAYVEILLSAGDVPEARAGAHELATIAADYGRDVLTAMAAQALGAVELAENNAGAALIALREACQAWQDVEAPYEVAQVRTMLGRACRELGDEDSAAWELAAARDVFDRLGANPEVTRLDALIEVKLRGGARGLTPRELQVLRLVAEGSSNKLIAEQIGLSERTIDRHVSNILTKLDVSSRTAATAFAYAHNLV